MAIGLTVGPFPRTDVDLYDPILDSRYQGPSVSSFQDRQSDTIGGSSQWNRGEDVVPVSGSRGSPGRSGYMLMSSLFSVVCPETHPRGTRSLTSRQLLFSFCQDGTPQLGLPSLY